MGEKINTFFKNYGGFVLGALIGLIVVLLDIFDILFNLAVIIACGFLGAYVQKNKDKVKESLKNQIDKW